MGMGMGTQSKALLDKHFGFNTQYTHCSKLYLVNTIECSALKVLEVGFDWRGVVNNM